MKKIVLGILMLAVFMGGAALAAAPNSVDTGMPAAEEIQDQYPNPVRDMMATYGKVTAVDGSKVTVTGEGNYPVIVARINSNTFILNGFNGMRLTKEDLQVGKAVTAYYSSKATKSYPAEAAAYAFVLGSISEETGKFFRVASVQLDEENEQTVVALNSNHDIKARISKNACINYDQIKSGDALLLWYNSMTLSIPAETTVDKGMIIYSK